MNALTTNIACVSLQDLLRFVLTFKSGFKELTFVRKSLIFIDNSSTDLGQINLEVHKYKLDSEVTLPSHNKTAVSSSFDIPPPSTCAYAAFINIATKNKAIYK